MSSESGALVVDLSYSDKHGDRISVRDAMTGADVVNLTRLELVADAQQGTDGRLELPSLRIFALDLGKWPPTQVVDGEVQLTVNVRVKVEVVRVDPYADDEVDGEGEGWKL